MNHITSIETNNIKIMEVLYYLKRTKIMVVCETLLWSEVTTTVEDDGR